MNKMLYHHTTEYDATQNNYPIHKITSHSTKKYVITQNKIKQKKQTHEKNLMPLPQIIQKFKQNHASMFFAADITSQHT